MLQVVSLRELAGELTQRKIEKSTAVLLSLENQMLKRLGFVGVAMTLLACATPPATYTISNTKPYQKAYDQVWEDLVSHLAKRNIQIKNIAKDSGVIYAESLRFDDSVADCGKPGIFQVVGRRANFNVFVNRSTKDPVVSVNSEFIETRRFESNIQTIQCNSKGVLEASILGAVS